MTYVETQVKGLALLMEMMSYCRPAGTKTERAFIKKYIDPLGCEIDRVGNRIKRIGDSNILWSSHTDTVHRREGQQKVVLLGDYIMLGNNEVQSSCLGADCTIGVWLMTEMIKAEVPGLYIFHRGEEIGGVGSSYIAKSYASILKGIKYAIAFDRKGVDSVITHQGMRCCSDEFAYSLANALFKAGLDGYKNDPSGTFTDTANYTELIGECTNISVGYYNQHTSKECQNVEFAMQLKEALIELDHSELVDVRQPGDPDPDWSHYRGRSAYGWRSGDLIGQGGYTASDFYDYDASYYSDTNLIDLISDYPVEVAEWLEENGISYDDLFKELYERGAAVPRRK